MRPLMVLLASALLLQSTAPGSIALRIRVFDGPQEVTPQARIALFKAGDHRSRIPASDGAFTVAPGFYDAQIIREQDGKVTGVRWAQQLVVMAYRQEDGQHLEVVNLQSGYGALEVKNETAVVPDAALFAKGERDTPIARRIDGDDYALFVVPAGTYDLRVKEGERMSWHPGIEVPADRTSFVLANQDK